MKPFARTSVGLVLLLASGVYALPGSAQQDFAHLRSVPADQPSPRSDRHSRIAHTQLVQLLIHDGRAIAREDIRRDVTRLFRTNVEHWTNQTIPV